MPEFGPYAWEDGDVGYWNTPCGADILTIDGSATSLAEHMRGCAACHAVLEERHEEPTVRYGERVLIPKSLAEKFGL